MLNTWKDQIKDFIKDTILNKLELDKAKNVPLQSSQMFVYDLT